MIRTIGIEKATLYDKYRLPYAPEAAEDLLAHVGQAPVVADIGAGTGQLARLFAGQSAKVYAVEPDPAMREVASASLQGGAVVEIVAGLAEQTGLAGNSVDLVVVGNAFHRFRPEACEELRRILKKSGWIALFTYHFLNETFTDMLFSRLATLPGLAGRIERAWPRTPLQELFGTGRIHTRRYRQSHAEDWTAFFGAACAGIEAPESHDFEFAQFEAINHQVFDAFTVNGRIQIEYGTEVAFGQPLVD